MKMAAKVGMYSGTHKSVTVPVGRDKKIRTALRTNQIARFVTVPSIFKDITLVLHWIDLVLPNNISRLSHERFKFSTTWARTTVKYSWVARGKMLKLQN